MALPDIPSKFLEEELAIGIYDLDDKISTTNSKLEQIENTLVEIFVVNSDTLKKLEGLFSIEADRRKDETLGEGLALEAAREKDDSKDVEISIKERIKEAKSDFSPFLLGLIAAGAGAFAFADKIADVINKIDNMLPDWLKGEDGDNLDNIGMGARAGLANQPKNFDRYKGQGKNSLTTGKASPQSRSFFGLGQGKGSLVTGQASPQSRSFFEKAGKVAKPVAGATAKAGKAVVNTTGELASTIGRKAGKVLLPLDVGIQAARWWLVENDDSLSQDEKDKEQNKILGGFGGAYAGAKAGILAGSIAGPWGMLVGGIVGGIGGSIAGEELVEAWYNTFGEEITPQQAEELRKQIEEATQKSKTQRRIEKEDRAMNLGVVVAPTETQMFGMNVQGYNAAAASKKSIEAENAKASTRMLSAEQYLSVAGSEDMQAFQYSQGKGLEKIDNVSRSISGNEDIITIHIGGKSKELADGNGKPIVINNNNQTNNNVVGGGGGKSIIGGGGMGSATKQNPGRANYREPFDPVHYGAF